MAGKAYKYSDIIGKDVEDGFKRLAKLSKDINTSLTTVKVAKSSGDGLKTLNKELKTTTGYTKSLSSLNKQRLATEKKAEVLRKKEIAQQNKLNDSLDVKIQTDKELLKLKQREIREQAKLTAEYKKYAKIDAKSLTELKKKNNALTKYKNNLDLTSKEYAQLTIEIAENTAKLKTEEKATGDHRREVGNYGIALEEITQRYGGLLNSMEAYGVGQKDIIANENGIKGTFASLKNGIVGIIKAGLAFIATPIGATIAALVAISAATKAFLDFNNEIVKTNEILEGITNETGKSVDEIRIRATALNEAFDKDIKETTETAQKLVNNFGITYAQAFDSIEEGLVRGGTQNDEYLDSLGEFSVFFSKAGFSVTEFQSVINAGFDLGIYKDKLPDAIKEFDLSIREQTKGTVDALVDAFGKGFSEDLLSRVNRGAITTKQALELIAVETDKVGLSSKQSATLTADLFKGAGEDAGGYEKIIDSVNTALNEQQRGYNEIEEGQRTYLDNQKEIIELKDEAFKSDSFLAFKNILIQGWDELVKYFLQKIIDIETIITGFTDGIKWIGNQITSLFNKFTQIDWVSLQIEKLSNYFVIMTEKVDLAIGKLRELGEYLNIIDTSEEKLYKTEIERTKGLNEQLKTLDAIAKGNITPYIKDLQNEYREGSITLTQYNDALNALIKSQNKIEPSLKSKKKSSEITVTNKSSLVTGDTAYGYSIPKAKADAIDNITINEFKDRGEFLAMELSDYRKTWFQKIKEGYSNGGVNGMIGAMFNVSDEDAQKIMDQVQQIYGEVMNIMQEAINQEKAINDEKLALADERISKAQEELTAEEDNLNKKKELGAAYDLSKKQALEKTLANERKEKEKALAEDKKIKQKQKNLEIINANINIASSVLQALGAYPPPYNFILAAIVGALGAVQLAQIKSAKYADGTNYVSLDGNKQGRDTVPAMLDAGERVVPKRDNANIPLTFPNSEIPTAINYYLNRNSNPNDGTNIILNDNNNDVYLSKIEKNTRTSGNVYKNGQLIQEKRGLSTINYN